LSTWTAFPKNLADLKSGLNATTARVCPTGGNKTRKLEFLMAEAWAQNADLVMTQGATQSNHARQTAAFAAKLGMDCHILLEDRTKSKDLNHLYNWTLDISWS